MRAFVVPDAHGDLAAVGRLLRQAGIIDGRQERVDHDTTVIQLGDLCNCVGDSAIEDVACLIAAPLWFDVYLVGNHEHPYFGGPRFSGFWPSDQVREHLLRLGHNGLVRPCVAVDGILVSHAGLTADWPWRKAETAERDLCALWKRDPAAEPFSRIGWSRGGSTSEGGLLWADDSEPKRRWFNQLYGHTHAEAVRTVHHPNRKWAMCIDSGRGHRDYSGMVGAWIRDGEVEIVRQEKAVAA